MTEGVMFGNDTWNIDIGMIYSSIDGGSPCKHCHSIQVTEPFVLDNIPFKGNTTWVCPYVVVGYAVCEDNSVGICLECIMDAEGKL